MSAEGRMEGGLAGAWPATIAEKRERVTEPVPAEDDGSQWALVGTPDQFSDEGDESS